MAVVNWSTAKRLDIQGIIKQDTLSWTILLKDNLGADYDVSSISKMVLTIKDKRKNTILTFDSDNADTTLVNGSLTGTKAVSSLSTIGLNVYFYDLQVTYTDLSVQTWLTGSVIFTDKATGESTTSATVTVNTGSDTVTLTVNNTYSDLASFSSLGTLDPTAMLFVQSGYYSAYTQSAAITFTISGSITNGICQVFKLTADGSNNISFDANFDTSALFGITAGSPLTAGDYWFYLLAVNDTIHVNVKSASV
jgi:hypothetical protein